MANALLIDDEIHVRNLLKFLIHWDELDLNLAGEFDNAGEAIECYRNNDIDIVITDIMMPEINGLDMIRKMQEINKNCKFILISGYRDFEFAQEAVRLGVSDYIVKPINEEDVNHVLLTIISGIKEYGAGDEKSLALRKKYIEMITKETKDLTIKKVQERYSLNFQEQGIFKVLQLGFCNCSEEDQIRADADKICNKLKQVIFANCIEIETFEQSKLRYDILFQYEKSKEEQILRCLDTAYREIVQRYKEAVHFRIYLSMGKAVDDINQVWESLDSAQFFLNGRLGYGDTRIYVADILPKAKQFMEEKNPISREDARKFERCIESVDENGIKQMIHKLFHELEKRDEINYTFYFYLTKDLFIHMFTVFNRLNVHPSELNKMENEIQDLIDNCDTVFMLRSMIERYCVDNVNRLLGGKQDNVQVYVNFTKAYIDEHYSENISLQVIADLAHVNAAYLSSVFKKNTGINYLTYLTSVRMEKAKELLGELDLNLSQIAEKVGYTSTRYFSKTFETEVGMKPSEYRRVYLREQR